MEKAQIKFDNYLDPLQLSAQFVKVEILKDYPKMITPITDIEWQTFFLHAAKLLSTSKLE